MPQGGCRVTVRHRLLAEPMQKTATIAPGTRSVWRLMPNLQRIATIRAVTSAEDLGFTGVAASLRKGRGGATTAAGFRPTVPGSTGRTTVAAKAVVRPMRQTGRNSSVIDPVICADPELTITRTGCVSAQDGSK